MSRNLNCQCLCHGSNGNRIGDTMFSCKNCYAANHMGNLPRFGYEQDERKPKKVARKPKTQTDLTMKVEPVEKPSGRKGVKVTIGA
jgi:hypothetical protein